jgi:hypothetical protein
MFLKSFPRKGSRAIPTRETNIFAVIGEGGQGRGRREYSYGEARIIGKI